IPDCFIFFSELSCSFSTLTLNLLSGMGSLLSAAAVPSHGEGAQTSWRGCYSPSVYGEVDSTSGQTDSFSAVGEAPPWIEGHPAGLGKPFPNLSPCFNLICFSCEPDIILNCWPADCLDAV